MGCSEDEPDVKQRCLARDVFSADAAQQRKEQTAVYQQQHSRLSQFTSQQDDKRDKRVDFGGISPAAC